MPFLLSHRSMTPPLYIGEECVVTDKDDAKLFPTATEAECFRWEMLGPMALLYTVAEEPDMTASRNLRKTTKWKSVAATQAATHAEAVASYERSFEALKEELHRQIQYAQDARDAHRRASQSLYAMTAMFVVAIFAMIIGWSR